MIVRRDARRTTCGDTLFFFLSDAAQDEFVQFLTNAAATLYDERKHNRDKTFKKQKVLTVASASRNGMCNTVPSVAGSSCGTAFDEGGGRHAAAVHEREWPLPKDLKC